MLFSDLYKIMVNIFNFVDFVREATPPWIRACRGSHGHMRNNAYYRDVKWTFEEFLPCYYYETKTNSGTLPSFATSLCRQRSRHERSAISPGRNEGAQVSTVSRAPNHYGSPNDCRERRKVPIISHVLSSSQYISFRKTSGSSMRRQTCSCLGRHLTSLRSWVAPIITCLNKSTTHEPLYMVTPNCLWSVGCQFASLLTFLTGDSTKLERGRVKRYVVALNI